MEISIIMIPIRQYNYTTRKGLAERQLKQRLQKQGWQVWRGGYLNKKDIIYPKVEQKYNQLRELITQLFGKRTLDYVCYLCSVHHGMPDYICYHPQLKKIKFVECKLGHEQLSPQQHIAIRKLQQKGFTVEVHKLVDACTKTRHIKLDLNTRQKKIVEVEKTLKQFIPDESK